MAALCSSSSGRFWKVLAAAAQLAVPVRDRTEGGQAHTARVEVKHFLFSAPDKSLWIRTYIGNLKSLGNQILKEKKAFPHTENTFSSML